MPNYKVLRDTDDTTGDREEVTLDQTALDAIGAVLLQAVNPSTTQTGGMAVSGKGKFGGATLNDNALVGYNKGNQAAITGTNGETASNASGHGVYGESWSSNAAAAGVYGVAVNAGYGVYGYAPSSNGIRGTTGSNNPAIAAINTDTNSHATADGISASTTSTSSSAAAGRFASTTGAKAIIATATGVTAIDAATTSGGIAVNGANSDSSNPAILGTNSSSAPGVKGTSTSGDGVLGTSATASKGGVHGTQSDPDGYAVWAQQTGSAGAGSALYADGSNNIGAKVVNSSSSKATLDVTQSNSTGVAGKFTAQGGSAITASNSGTSTTLDVTNNGTGGSSGDAITGTGKGTGAGVKARNDSTGPGLYGYSASGNSIFALGGSDVTTIKGKAISAQTAPVIGAYDNSDNLVIGLYASGKIKRGGTSFPSSPSSGDTFFRTDRGIEYYYDGTRWLSVNDYTATLVILPIDTYPITAASSPNTCLRSPRPEPDTTYIYVTDLLVYHFTATTFNASNFWSVQLSRSTTSGSSTIGSGTSLWQTGRSPGTTYTDSIPSVIGTVLDNTAPVAAFFITWTKTGTPGNCSPITGFLKYKKIG